MIKVNLGTSYKPVSGRGGAGIVFEGGGEGGLTPAELQKQALSRALLLVVGPLALWAYAQITIPDLIVSRNNKNTHLTELRTYNVKKERSVQEIKRFKEDEKKIEDRIAYLDKLSKNRLREIKILDLLQQVVPEKVWFTKVQSKEGKITVAGMAMSDFDISSFMESLAKSVYFLDVNLLDSTEMVVDGLPVKKFEIVCSLEKVGA